MAANFPTSLPDLPTLDELRQDGTTFADLDLLGEQMTEWMAQVSAELLAIAARLGVTGTSDATAVLYQVAHAVDNTVPQAQTYSNGAWRTPTAVQSIAVIPQRDPDPRT